MENQLKIVQVKNPLRITDRQILPIPFSEKSIKDICAELMPADMDIVVRLNGMSIDRQFWKNCIPRPGDELVIMPVLGDDKVWAAVAMIAVIIAAPYAATAVLGAYAAMEAPLLYTITTAAFIATGGMLINSAFAKPAPKSPAFDSDISQSYGWNPLTLQKEGIVLPKFYGQNKLYGNVISAYSEPDESDYTKEVLNILIALGEGPVQGIVEDSIQINDQPADNYSDVTTEEKKGTLNQTKISLVDKTKPEYKPNILVTNTGGAVTYETPDNDFDDLDIELLFDRGIYFANNAGGLSNHSIGIKIEISVHDAGSWSTLVAETVTDNQTAAIRKNYTASETYTGGSPVTITNGNHYDIKVTKTTSDQDSTRYGDNLRIGAVREVLNDEFTYPGLSLLGVSALATDQLYGSLNISCVQQGKVIRVYNGSSWSIEYSNNPAWVLWDILTEPVISGDGDGTPYAIERYRGMDPDRLDLEKFYELAQFCDTMVPDGNGGTEKRITFNGGFDTGTSRWQAALKVCEIARCLPIWDGVEITLAIDKSDTPVQMFSVGNILKDSFQRTYLPQEERASEIEIHYRDSDQDYERTPFTIFDSQIDNPANKVTLELFGITKQSEAWRAGLFRLRQNRLLKSTIDFGADIDALACTIGDIIYVQHDVPNWTEGGRVVSATVNTVTVEKDITPSGGTDKILVRVYNPAGGIEQIEDHVIQSISGNFITIVDTWGVIPSKDNIYIVGSSTKYKKPYRITSLRRDSELQVKISAIEYNEQVYDWEESDSPPLPIEGYSSPQSDKKEIIKPVTRREIKDRYPDEVTIGPPVLVVPQLSTVQFVSEPDSKIGWTAGVIVYKGNSYDIAAEGTGLAEKYIYWDQNNTPTSFHGTDTLAEAYGQNKWVMCINNNGIPHLVWNGQPYWGEMVFVETLAAITAQLGAVLAGSITGTIITGGLLRTAISGKRIQIDQDGIKLLMAAPSAGKVGTVGNGGDNIVIGQTITKTITNITKASNAKVTAASHGFSIGNRIKFVDVGGMTEINYENLGDYGVITDDDPDGDGNAFEVNVDSTEFSDYTSGGEAKNGSGEIIGSGYLGMVYNTGYNIPFWIQSEQTVADMHMFNRNNTPSGAAQKGDLCTVQNELYECTTAGTPGTWEKVNR